MDPPLPQGPSLLAPVIRCGTVYSPGKQTIIHSYLDLPDYFTALPTEFLAIIFTVLQAGRGCY